MIRAAFDATLQRMQGVFLRNQPRPTPEGWDPAIARACVEAARARLKPARRFADSGETIAALVLYSDATRLLWSALRDQLKKESGAARPELERQAALFSGADPSVVDRMSVEVAAAAVQDLDRLTTWALALLDRPSERQRPVQRLVWFSGLGLVLLVFIVTAVVWLRRPRNLALGRPVASSSVAFGTTPEGAVDGVRYGWLGFHSGGEESEWWSVDLGRAYALDRVEAYGRADCCFDQSVPLGFEVSLDGETYRSAAERSEEFSQFDPWVIPGDNLVARFIRFRTLRKTFLVLGEVEVYGRPK
jgi:hypothetical protein